MAEDESVVETQEPEVGSEEWQQQTLAKLGLQGEEQPEEEPKAAEKSPQGDESEVAEPEEADKPKEEKKAAPSWREVIVPEDDESVPKEYRGKPITKFYEDLQKTAKAGQEVNTRLRQTEAELAAAKTFKEMLGQTAAAQQQEPTPANPYEAAGLDLETAPILDPKTFFTKQDEIWADRTQRIAQEAVQKALDEQKQLSEAERENIEIGVALDSIAKEYQLSEDQMKVRIPSLLMVAGEQKGRQALRDPAVLKEVHDSIFGRPEPAKQIVDLPPSKETPNPPGSKKPAVLESAAKQGYQFKSYEKDHLAYLEEKINESSGGKYKVDPDQLAAAYAANLKKARRG